MVEPVLREFNPGPGVRNLLHVGCGRADPTKIHPMFREPDWREIRVDVDPAASPDIVASMTDLSMFPDGAIDGIWASHCLEHLEAHEVPTALGEFHRVTADDALALIVVPDLERVARLVASGRLDAVTYTSRAGPVAAIDMIYGLRRAIAQGHRHMAHRTGFTPDSLGTAITRAGFAGARLWRGRGFDLWALAAKSDAMMDRVRAMSRPSRSAAAGPTGSPRDG